MKSQTFVLEVWGDFACFSRPEMKVERFSYPAPPPSAVRGIFDAIYSKPKEFHWQPEKVEILTEPSYIALRRNEVKDKISAHAVEKWARGNAQPEPIWADGDEDLLGTDQKGRTLMAFRMRCSARKARISPPLPSPTGFTCIENSNRERASNGE